MPERIVGLVEFPGYSVGALGTVWSAWKTRRRSAGGRGLESFICDVRKPLKLKVRDDGYLSVALRKDGKYHGRLVHRLVLEAFVGPCPKRHECCHKDGDRQNNKRSNLYWGTRQDNMNDMIRHGLSTKGEKNSQAKLTDEQVVEIVKLIDQGTAFRQIAELFPVGEVMVAHIARGESWTHITGGVNRSPGHWSRGPNRDKVIAKREETKSRQGR